MDTTRSAILYEPPGPVPFPRAWAWQRQLQERLLCDPESPEAVLLLEQEPCYTLGRGASTVHLRFDPDAPPLPLHRIDRGGEVTHHAPGQLVLYPVLNLQRRHGRFLAAVGWSVLLLVLGLVVGALLLSALAPALPPALPLTPVQIEAVPALLLLLLGALFLA